jgi:hypothetical protein
MPRRPTRNAHFLLFKVVFDKCSAISEDFASELSKVFHIEEDPLVEELESSLREK